MGDDAGDRLADPAPADDYAGGGGGDPAQRDSPLSPVNPADAGRDVDAGVPDDLLSEGSPLRDGLDDAPALDAVADQLSVVALWPCPEAEGDGSLYVLRRRDAD